MLAASGPRIPARSWLRRTHVVLGRSLARRSGRQPDALRGGFLAEPGCLLAADMGNGIRRRALVQNFENLNPANTLWKNITTCTRKVDTETPRFLEFERWWGGFPHEPRGDRMDHASNLFIGNKLWSGTSGAGRQAFDLREITSPIVLFASMGDNITPPQQAFNWVLDMYESTEEIKARGQMIVGLMHQDIGHLGIFVSGRVAKKEHSQIVSVLKSIETLPPGINPDADHRAKRFQWQSRTRCRFVKSAWRRCRND